MSTATAHMSAINWLVSEFAAVSAPITRPLTIVLVPVLLVGLLRKVPGVRQILHPKTSESEESTSEESQPNTSIQDASENFDKLLEWINGRDDPITSPNEDLFGHRIVAQRIARRLRSDEPELPTIALVGDFGSGKTTICELVKHELKRTGTLDSTIGFANMSMWQFDSVQAAVAAILRKLIQTLGQHVNVLGLSGLPGGYVHAIEKASGPFGGFTRFLSGPSQPDALLKVLEQITLAIDFRVVLWIEDLERFAGTSHLTGPEADRRDVERLQPIRALLYQLDACKGISVIVADGSLDSRFDLEKIARFVEQPPHVDLLNAWKCIRTYLLGTMDNFSDLIHPAKTTLSEDFSLEAVDMGSSALLRHRFDEGKPSLNESVVLLLDTPRKLRNGLRTCDEAWSTLRGEIDLRDVLIMSVLKVARPNIFSLVERKLHEFRKKKRLLPEREDIEKDDSGLRTDIHNQLGNEINPEAESAVIALLEEVFPQFKNPYSERHWLLDSVSRPQAICSNNSHVDYWKRYSTMEPITEKDSDQA